MIPTNKDFVDNFGYQIDLAMTIPHSTPEAGQPYALGVFRWVPIGSDYFLPASLVGKTLTKTDSTSTTTTVVSKKFVSTEFLNPEKPLLSEVVAALNSGTVAAGTGWDETTDTDATAVLGALQVNAAASSASANLSFGGDAAPLLGLGPGDGITVNQKTDATSGIVITFPAYFAGKYTPQWAYTRNPKVYFRTLTLATGVLSAPSTAPSFTWTPSTRVLLIQCAATPGTTAVTRITVQI